MKILIIQPFIKQGGAELESVYLAHNLAKVGHQVKIAAIFTDFSGMIPITRNLTYVLPNKPIQVLAKKSRFFLYFLGPFFLFRLVLREKEVDILNPHNLPAYLIAPLVGELKKIPVVWNCNETPQKISLRQGAKVGLSDWLMWRIAGSPLEKFFVAQIDKILVLSEMTKKQVKARYQKEVVVVRLGVDFAFFSQVDEAEIERIKNEYNLKDKFVILVVGKLHPLKTPSFALLVFKLLAKKIPNAVLVFVGAGPLEKELKEKAKVSGLSQRVLFPGFVSSEELRSWYQVCALNLVPVFNLSWGLASFEALCAKKTSIVSESCGAAEVFKKEKIGLVAKLTVEDFAQEILGFYQHQDEFGEMAERGHAFVKNLTWEKYARNVLANFKEVINEEKKT